MSMKIGIVGLPNVGKSTLFNALTKTYAADAANFPFCTIEPNVGIVDVVDERIDKLSEISHTQKKVYAAIKFVDIAGLVKWASKGEGLGNKFLSHIREVDAIVQVLRHFSDGDVMHVEGSVDPFRDVEIINMELIMSDIEQIEPKLPSLEKRAKAQDKEAMKLYPVLKTIYDALMQWKLAYEVKDEFSGEPLDLLRSYNLLTFKPFVYAINVSQEELANADAIKKEFEEKLKRPVAIVCAKIESEMLGFSPEERKEFIADMHPWKNIPTLDDMISLAFDTLGLMYYFTTGEKETRAWTIEKWSRAPQAAAAIHTDFEKKFIKAEVVTYEKFIDAGWRSQSREKWYLRLEWKEYIVQEGDIITFKIGQ